MARRATRKVRSRSSSTRTAGKAGKPSRKSLAEEQLLEALQRHQLLSGCEREHKFYETRRWRFDFAWRAQRVAVEVEGGVWNGGRHVTPKGFISDCEKYTRAALEGWTVLRFVPAKNWTEEAIPLIVEALSA